MKKRIVSLIMAATLTATLAGCANGGEESKTFAPDENAYTATINSLVSTDALGRSFGENSVAVSEKKVGLFYFVWHGYSTNSGIFDITKLLEENPSALWGTDSESVKSSPINAFHYWGEPLYGYYASDDPYIVKKHLELFIASGIDYICLDLTNLFIYENVIEVLIEEIQALQAQGWNPPTILPMFGNNPASVANVPVFYEKFHKNHPEYDSAWYKVNGYPVISMETGEYVDGTGAYHYGFEELSDEIKDYFAFRHTLWPMHYMGEEEILEDGMLWMDWVYPQQVSASGYMNVSVAQHPSYAFSYSENPETAAANYNANKGRGYNFTRGENDASMVLEGTNLAAQWRTALKNSDKVNEVMVTGWNEWIAQKLQGSGYYVNTPNDRGTICFADTFNTEFSRDLEMMNGGYGDNFYLQNMQNVRKFKGSGETKFAAGKASADIYGSSGWNAGRIYMDVTEEAIKRDFDNAAHTAKYVNDTARNDIVSVEVVNDDECLYIRVTTADDIAIEENANNNLNILLSVSGVSSPRWEGYNFIINRTAPTKGRNTVAVEKVTENGKFAFASVGSAESFLDGKIFAVKIPLSVLGAGKDFTVDIKVADGISDPSDIMRYYTDGDSAPAGRLNYRYNSGR